MVNRNRFREKSLAHTISRFNERSLKDSNCKKEKFTNLTTFDYKQLCNLCRDKPIIITDVKPYSDKSKRCLVYYNNVFLWCIYHSEHYFVKTTYPAANVYYRIKDYIL